MQDYIGGGEMMKNLVRAQKNHEWTWFDQVHHTDFER